MVNEIVYMKKHALRTMAHSPLGHTTHYIMVMILDVFHHTHSQYSWRNTNKSDTKVCLLLPSPHLLCQWCDCLLFPIHTLAYGKAPFTVSISINWWITNPSHHLNITLISGGSKLFTVTEQKLSRLWIASGSFKSKQ